MVQNLPISVEAFHTREYVCFAEALLSDFGTGISAISKDFLRQMRSHLAPRACLLSADLIPWEGDEQQGDEGMGIWAGLTWTAVAPEMRIDLLEILRIAALGWEKTFAQERHLEKVDDTQCLPTCSYSFFL